MWTNNKKMPVFASHGDTFDSRRPTALPYTPLARPALEEKLRGMGLMHEKKMFTPGVLNALYDRLAQLQVGGAGGRYSFVYAVMCASGCERRARVYMHSRIHAVRCLSEYAARPQATVGPAVDRA